MLLSRRLDDQPYEEIVREAVGRLPWLCPQWTDHNAHDPGITLIELMAWYKEMLQYQMDQCTPALTRGLLRLAGTTPAPPQPAACALELPPGSPARPALSRLVNQQDVCFELQEPFCPPSLTLTRAQIEQNGSAADVRELLSDRLELQPFRFGGQDGSVLALGFAGTPGESLRLWLDVTPPAGAARTPFAPGQQPPRRIAWDFAGAGAAAPQSDDTHALSQSGDLRFAVPAGWQPDAQGIYWLRLSLTHAGCEEQPRLRGVSDRRYPAVQQQTRAHSHFFTVPARAAQTVQMHDALSHRAELAVFVRTAQGWEQLARYEDTLRGDARTLRVDASAAADDGRDNLLVVCLDPLRVHDLLFDTVGRPGEEIYLNLDGQTALPQHFRLLCQTLQRDGSVRPALWRPVDDLYACGPRDQVFVYDAVRETISFGNGRYGAIPVPGKGSVLVMELAVSRCGAGNVPAGAGLRFADGTEAANAAAAGGRDGETLAQAGGRLLRRLQSSGKCLSAADYEEMARRTPGLRVAAARALPGFDPQAPAGRVAPAMVTVVVLPASDTRRPLPDRAFLQAVDRQLARCRMIGIRTQTIAPQYVEVDVAAQLRVQPGLTREAVQQALETRLSAAQAAFGAPVQQDDIAALLQKLPGVLEVRRLELRGLGNGAYRTVSGDLRIPPAALAVLRRAELELLRV